MRPVSKPSIVLTAQIEKLMKHGLILKSFTVKVGGTFSRKADYNAMWKPNSRVHDIVRFY